jgi:copper(I)-binding protein
MKRFILAVTTAILLTACSDPSSTVDVDAVTTNANTPSVLISEGYIMPPLLGRDVAGGFFIAENQGPATRIVSASSPSANAVEIHTHSMADGVMQMREVDAVDLPENGSIAFEPGSFHLMMFGFSQAEDQAEAQVNFVLDSGEEFSVSLPIRQRGE